MNYTWEIERLQAERGALMAEIDILKQELDTSKTDLRVASAKLISAYEDNGVMRDVLTSMQVDVNSLLDPGAR